MPGLDMGILLIIASTGTTSVLASNLLYVGLYGVVLGNVSQSCVVLRKPSR